MTLFHVHCEMKRGGGNSYRDNLQFILPPAGGNLSQGGSRFTDVIDEDDGLTHRCKVAVNVLGLRLTLGL